MLMSSPPCPLTHMSMTHATPRAHTGLLTAAYRALTEGLRVCPWVTPYRPYNTEVQHTVATHQPNNSTTYKISPGTNQGNYYFQYIFSEENNIYIYCIKQFIFQSLKY